jgi:hypothetical protein
MRVRRRTSKEQTTNKYNPNLQIMKIRISIFLLMLGMYAQAQIKVGNNPNSINANSLLELESTNKGFLPPRVALNSFSSVSPLSGTVPAGMLVFSSGGSLTDGYYYWNGALWVRLAGGESNMVAKTADATLTKLETFVLASNDITLTLPVITASDNGLEISVKNVGSHTDLVTVKGNGSATVDNLAQTDLSRYLVQTFVADNGNWILKGNLKFDSHLLNVDANSSWTTIEEAMEFLALHMDGPAVVRLMQPENEIANTITINLPYPVTFQGSSFGLASIIPATGLAGNPMFRCVTESYFKMLVFDANPLTNYGTQPGEDAIRLLGSGTYHEIKDCTFDRFYNTILDSSDAELWLFECDISNAVNNGVLLHSDVPGVKLRISETDFIHCANGVNMDKGSAAIVNLISGSYLNVNGTDSAIIYQPATFTSPEVIGITGNSWNNIGKYIEGFDFTRSDGRDANVIIESNAGIGNKNPNCTVGVLNNVTTTSITSGGSWYKANWTNTSSTTTKWTIGNNRITYQPSNKRNGWFVISGNVQCNNANRTVSIGIVKNNASGTRYGETTLRITTGNQPFQFSTVVYLSDIAPGDYFELFCTSNSSSDLITFQDIQWFANAQ